MDHSVKISVMKGIIVTLTILLFGSISDAQNILLFETNIMRDSDSLSMQPVSFSWCGDGGDNCIWDFSSIKDIPGVHPIKIKCDSLGNHMVYEDGCITSYCFFSDTLKQTKLENRTHTIDFQNAIFRICFPFHYGDSVTQVFSGTGTYCSDHHLKTYGQTSVIADGLGKLILSEKDTIDNVLRIYTLTTISMGMDIDSIALDTAMLKQEIVEQYEWYARGYRYPLYKTIQRTSYSGQNIIASHNSAYRILPEDFSLCQYDEQNDSLLTSDNKQNGHPDLEKKDIFHYDLQIIGNKVILNYKSDESANVNTLISDVMGIVHRCEHWTCRGEESGKLEIDCTGMKKGNYILYINVNGTIHSNKIVL